MEAQILLETAKKDLEAARLLYSEKFYAQAVFYLEQAIEKGTKALGIKLKIISDEKETKDIGHHAWRLYLKMVEKIMEQTQKIEELWKATEEQILISDSSSSQELKKVLEEIINPSIKQVLEFRDQASEFKDIVNTYSKEITFGSALSQEALKKIQNILNKVNKLRKEALNYSINNKIIESLNAWRALFDQTLNSISDPNLRSALIQVSAQLTSQMETISAFIKKQHPCYIRLGFCLIYSLFLSLIFSPHSVKSRYPKEGFNPSKVYTDRLPLIQTFKFFLKSAKVFLEDLEYVLKCDLFLTIT
jgi:HEPN domain-containing protein